MSIGKLTFILCAASIAGSADNTGGVLGPVTGYVLDAKVHAIRPMMGFPGAAYLGAPAVTSVDAAWVSPDAFAAFVVRGGQAVLYTGLGNTAPVAAKLSGVLAADYFAWGPSSTAAALYSAATRQAQILTNLLSAPSAGGPIDLTSLSGQVTAIAFDGQRVILAVSSPAGGGIYIATAQEGPRLLVSAISPASILLAGADLYFADNRSQEIWQVKSYATGAAPAMFANDAAISSPAGLQLSADGSRLYVANAGSRTLGVYDVATHAPEQSITLNFTPTRLDRFGSGSVFLLNSAGQTSTPLYVLSEQLNKRAVYFVPGAGVPGHPRPAPYKPQ
ncbi:MAG TPA: hypothetical protein VMT86_12520 [Bryobacteraceae bacterium]|nr:hypothetical protein [Bryobacteraceae bacterium]